MNVFFFIFLVIFAISFILLKNFLIPFFRIHIPDKPNQRSLHLKVKPRSGGIIFVVFSLLSIFISNNQIFLIILPLSLIGLLDDLKGISQKIRFIIQFFTVTYLFIPAYSNWGINELNIFFIILIFILFNLIGIGTINFVNFLDGIDGLVSGCFWIIVLTLLLSNNYFFLTPLLAALTAFIMFNWSPSKIFMGDVGSTFLGAMFVGFIFESNELILGFKTLLLAFPILLDSIYTLINKIIYKQPILSAHSQHLYQRLVKGGWSHSNVSTIYILLTFMFCLGYIFDSIMIQIVLILFTLYLGFYL